ncbi:MAG: hypothetical protein HQM11_14565 [SAR324 cluster bacterium]|nr:hypothetical protein [SAR324 cluster bacterium]
MLSRPSSLILSWLLLGLIAACTNDTGSQQELENSDMVLSKARFVGFNLTDQDRINGVTRLVLSGTQPFESIFWKWHDNGLKGNSLIPTISKDGQTISLFHVQSSPLASNGPVLLNSKTSYPSLETPKFSDKTFPRNIARFQGVVPIYPRRMYTTNYDKNGTVVTTPTNTVSSWTLKLNKNKILTEATLISKKEGNTDNQFVTKSVFTYGKDPFGGSFYATDKVVYKDASEDISFEVKTSRTVTSDDKYNTRIEEITCYNVDEEIGDYCELGYARQSITEETDKVAQTRKTTTVRYSGEKTSTEFLREVNTIDYYDLSIEKMQRQTILRFTKSAGVSSAQITKDYEYDNNGNLVHEYNYNPVFLASTKSYTLNAKGRPGAVDIFDQDDKLTFEALYTYDTLGRKSSRVAYDIGSSQTCSSTDITENSISVSGGKQEYSYSQDADSITFSIVKYNCINNGIAIDPSNKTEYTYDLKGRLITSMAYNYSTDSSKFILATQVEYTYDLTGEKTKEQYYYVDDTGDATKSYNISYEYDANLYLKAKKFYDSEGNLCKDGATDTTTQLCVNACEAEVLCYTVTSYIYE